MELYMALIHYPVYDKNGNVICSAITPMDLHDLARLSVTFGIKKCYIANPLKEQQELAKRIVEHWVMGYGANYNPLRRIAFERIRLVGSLEDALEDVAREEGMGAFTIATDASQKRNTIGYGEAKRIMETRPSLIMFGTAWGLHQDIIDNAHCLLEPIYGVGDYNHLSVRTAAAIILDRLISRQ